MSTCNNAAEEKALQRPTSYWYIAPVSLGMGLCFGFALEKGRVFEPSVIIDQMLMLRFQMMKMFLSAVATSMVGMSALSLLPATAKYFNLTRSHFFTAPRSLLSVAVGAAVLGAGMALGGACPGTTIVQLGAGVNQGLFIVLGGLLAGGLYSYNESLFRPFITNKCLEPEKCTIDRMIGTSYASVAIPFASVLVGLITWLEYIRPWHTDLGGGGAVPPSTTIAPEFYSVHAWPPQVAGVLVGLLQIPAVLLLRVTLGSASSFSTVAVNIINCACPRAVEASQHMSSLRSGIALWQPTYLFGALLGALLSSYLSGSWHSVSGLSPLWAFLTGFILVGGSRLAGGCTSGHGISGMAQLSTTSLIAVSAMFGSGIGSAFLLRALGYYDNLGY